MRHLHPVVYPCVHSYCYIACRYARTHKHPAKHPWFDTVKSMHHVLAHTVAHPNLELFGENMTATHSISYGNLTSYFYLFGARKRGVWCSWDEVTSVYETCF